MTEKNFEAEIKKELKINLSVVSRNFAKLFLKLWSLIAVCALIGGVISFAFTAYSFDPLYRSEATFTVTTNTSDSLSGSGYGFFYDSGTAEQLGLRDSRRIEGMYSVTVEDALSGRHFEDAVSPVHFCLDVHHLAPDYRLPPEVEDYRFKPFDIPMRSLISSQVNNLFMVGRCISGDFLAHSAYRTTCTACALGEAAGLAASRLHSEQSAKETDGIAVHRELIQRGYHFAL